MDLLVIHNALCNRRTELQKRKEKAEHETNTLCAGLTSLESLQEAAKLVTKLPVLDGLGESLRYASYETSAQAERAIAELEELDQLIATLDSLIVTFRCEKCGGTGSRRVPDGTGQWTVACDHCNGTGLKKPEEIVFMAPVPKSES